MNENNDEIKAEVLENSEEEQKNVANTVTLVGEEKKETQEPEKKEKREEESYKFKESKKVIKTKKNHKFVILAIVVSIILILALLFSTIFAFINSNSNTILGGISVRKISVEGLTEDEAIKVISDKLEYEKSKELSLKINGESYYVTPEQIGIEYNINKAVETAFNVGRDGNIFQNNYEILLTMVEKKDVELEISYDEKLLNNVISEINAKLPNAMVDNTYSVEEKELIITRGTSGIVVDSDDIKQVLLNAIQNGTNDELEIKTAYKECPEIDIEKIHSEVKTEPQDATFKTNPFEIIPHKTGLDFDVEKAKEILKEDKEEYVIPLNIIEPKVHTNEIGSEAFPNLLSSFSTKYDSTNVPRSKNLQIAMSKLDGVVVMPGEVFSYNKTLGKRTVQEGYQYANGFAAGKVVPMLAGGICQISSTLYDAALYANMNIVERHNHMFQATYV